MPDTDAEYERNSKAYRRLKETISWNYRHGWFVGISEEQVVGVAEAFRALDAVLCGQGKGPRRVFLVQTAVDYPEYVTIF
jgi:exopolyphosphatase/pppGpp-phosphohydrolase